MGSFGIQRRPFLTGHHTEHDHKHEAKGSVTCLVCLWVGKNIFRRTFSTRERERILEGVTLDKLRRFSKVKCLP